MRHCHALGDGFSDAPVSPVRTLAVCKVAALKLLLALTATHLFIALPLIVQFCEGFPNLARNWR